jgi:DNA-binding ferritin-like protein
MFPEENKIEHAKLKETELNLKLSNWDTQFKLAIEIGDQTENDLFEGLENDFDKEAW